MDWSLCVLLMVLLAWSAFADWIKHMYTSNQVTTSNRRAVLHDGDFSYVAGLNYLIAIDRSKNTFQVINFPPQSGMIKFCKSMLGDDSLECQNALQVVERYNETDLLICSAPVREKKCYFVDKQTFSKTEVDFRSIHLWLPQDPTKSIVTYLSDYDKTSQLFVAACLPKCYFVKQESTARTSYPDVTFEEPTFYGIHTNGVGNNKRIYLFFREHSNAFQYDGFKSGGSKSGYGMVARVCNNDTGGVFEFINNFVTFMKARLLCPYPGGEYRGSTSTYYDYLNATAQIGNIVYGIFTYPPSWKTKSTAVCGFDLTKIDFLMEGNTFEDGISKYYDPNSASSGYAVTYDIETDFLPGQCPKAGQSTGRISGAYESFLLSHVLLASSFEPLLRKPSYLSTTETFHHLAVIQIGKYHIFYLFKETGLMRKIRVDASDGSNTVVLAEAQVTNGDDRIISASATGKDIIVVTPVRVLHVAKAYCSLYTDCQKCEADPSCDWVRGCVNSNVENISIRTCSTKTSTSNTGKGNKIHKNVKNGNNSSIFASYYYEAIRIRDAIVVSSGTVAKPDFALISSSLKPGIFYILKLYGVRETERGSSRDWNPIDVREFLLDLAPPVLSLSASANTMVGIEWRKVIGAVSYNVTLYCQDNTKRVIQSYVVSASDNNSPKEKLGMAGLIPGESYQVVVFAMSVEGWVSNVSEPIKFTTSSFHLPINSIAILSSLVLVIILIVGILIQNCRAIGGSTVTTTGETLTRKYGCFWLKEDTRGQFSNLTDKTNTLLNKQGEKEGEQSVDPPTTL